MIAQKRVLALDTPPAITIHLQIGALTLARKDREAIEKDLHLLDAAFATDKLIASLDEAVRAALDAASEQVRGLKLIVWVNPERDDEQPLAWLRAGALSERERRLGFRATPE